MKQKIGRIGVLMGGPSSEREISFKSGWTVYQALKNQGLDVLALDIRNRVEEKLKQAKLSLAFIALHGKFGEDGTIQKILESLRIPYTGSGVMASYLCLDKIVSRRIFQYQHIPVPKYAVINRHSWMGRVKEVNLNFPLVVKPSSQGSSIGVTFVDKRASLTPALNLAFKYDETVIIEEYIKGREITVGILEERPLPIVEVIPKHRFFDFRAKYEKGQSDYAVPAKLPKSCYQTAQKIGLLAHQVLGCRTFSRVDMILRGNKPVVLEVNSIPGLMATSLLPMAAEAQGINFGQLCLKIAQAALSNDNQCKK